MRLQFYDNKSHFLCGVDSSICPRKGESATVKSDKGTLVVTITKVHHFPGVDPVVKLFTKPMNPKLLGVKKGSKKKP